MVNTHSFKQPREAGRVRAVAIVSSIVIEDRRIDTEAELIIAMNMQKSELQVRAILAFRPIERQNARD
jgi:hypothetical protein